MPEATTRAAALLSGQVEFVEAPSPDTIPRLKSSGMRVITLPYPHNWHYQLNFVEPPFNDLRVRRAANHALNRAEMVEMLGGIAQEGYATYPPNAKLYGNPVNTSTTRPRRRRCSRRPAAIRAASPSRSRPRAPGRCSRCR
jgi:peptide/nickel transport system substrate-binding protein